MLLLEFKIISWEAMRDRSVIREVARTRWNCLTATYIDLGPAYVQGRALSCLV